MTSTSLVQKQNTGEFVALMAFLMSLVALAIDAVLPAFQSIGSSYDISDENRLQLIIGILFLGLAVGQLFFGPISDFLGRKVAIYIGVGLFIVGSLISAFAPSYETLLVGRFLQGFGVAGPRIISVALVRDQYSGREMARIMSFVISVFIIMPAMAPALGAGLMMFSDWHSIFYSFAVLSIISCLWLWLRQPETHPKEKRTTISLVPVLLAFREVLTHRRSAGYMLIAGVSFACLISYLSVAKLLFFDIYQVDELFPFYFAILSLAVGAASFANGRLVMKYGMRALMHWALLLLFVTSCVFLLFLWLGEGHVPFIFFMVAMSVIFFSMGLLFGNSNAMAMEPMGHIAGVASSIIGAGTTLVSMGFGTVIGQFYDKTLVPMVIGFVVLSLIGFLIMQWVELKKA